MPRRNHTRDVPRFVEMLRHARVAGEEIADQPEHRAEIDEDEPGPVLEDEVLAGEAR